MDKMPEGIIGMRVRAARERLGMSQAELARRIVAPVYGLNILEHGATSYPRADRVYALAKALGVSADYLLGLTEGMGEEEDSQAQPAAVALTVV